MVKRSVEVCIPDHLFLIAMGALLWADLQAQTCDLCVNALGTSIWTLRNRADFFGLCFNVLMKKREKVTYWSTFVFDKENVLLLSYGNRYPLSLAIPEKSDSFLTITTL